MPEKTENEENATWTQTLTMVTPEEDARIRTINDTTVVSAPGGTPLDLGLNQIADRRTVQMNTMRRDLFVDSVELTQRISHGDVACQTFLQGVPKVELPSTCTDEATQTLYMGHDSPPARAFEDITRIMNDRIPPVAGKITEHVQTVITFELDASQNRIVDGLTNELTAEQLEENDSPESQAMAAASTCATDNIHFILDRVFWLTDPGYRPTQVEVNNEAAQTSIKYDRGRVLLDADTQTLLSCEPGRSTTNLLSEWAAMKDIARSIIDECLEMVVRPRTIVHSILDGVVERTLGQIRSEYKHQAVQTLAPCNALKDKDDEVLRQLRLEVVFDPFESSKIALPLVEILVERACQTVRQDAPRVAAQILDRIQKKSTTIGKRLAAIRFEAGSHENLMDNILDARKKRLKELLRDRAKTKQCSGTQTELAGVPEIGKFKEPRDTICATCPRHSGCYVCEASLANSSVSAAETTQDPFPNRILKTRDILIAYNPCYVVTTPPEIPKTRPLVMPRRLSANHPWPPLRASASRNSSSREPNSDGTWRENVPCPPRPRPAGSQRLQNQGSLTDWARVVQETSSLSGAWSIRGSSSADSNTIDRQIGLSSPSYFSKNYLKRECPRSGCDVPVRSIKALRVLKKTFNRNEESCSDCSYDADEPSVKPDEEKAVRTGCPCVIHSGDPSNPAGMDIMDREKRWDFPGTVQGQRPNETPDGEGVRVVPIIHLTHGINSEN